MPALAPSTISWRVSGLREQVAIAVQDFDVVLGLIAELCIAAAAV